MSNLHVHSYCSATDVYELNLFKRLTGAVYYCSYNNTFLGQKVYIIPNTHYKNRVKISRSERIEIFLPRPII